MGDDTVSSSLFQLQYFIVEMVGVGYYNLSNIDSITYIRRGLMGEDIQLIEINKSYFGDHIETHVLNAINLTFDRHELTAIVGSSGSGKSTLLSIIETLDHATTGKVEFCGAETSTLKGNQLADFRFETIGFIFQHFHLIPTLTAFENVVSPFFGRKTAIKYNDKAHELFCKPIMQSINTSK